MNAASNTVILCRFCGYISADGAPEDGRCARCGAFSGLEAVAGDDARRRSRRTRLGFLRNRMVRAGIILAPLLALVFWLLWEYTGLPPDPPAPSTNIGDASIAPAPGDWPQAGGGIANHNAAGGADGIHTDGIPASGIHTDGVQRDGIPADGVSSGALAPPATVWRYAVGSPVIAPPAVVGQRVYLTAEDGSVTALDKGSGAVVWRYESGLFAGVTPAVSDGLVFVVFRPGVVTVLDAGTGQAVWSKRLGTASLASPAVADGRLFVAETDRSRLLALDAATGATLWDYRLGDWVIAPPAIIDGKVVATANEVNVHILDASTGRLRMYYDAGRGRWARGTALVTDDLLHFSSSGGRVWGIDYRGHRYPLERAIIYIRTLLWVWGFTQQGPAQQGHIWSTQTGGEQPYAPALAGDALVVADAAGVVTGLDAGSGAIRWETDLAADIPAGATVAGDAALVATEGGALWALSASDGARRWTAAPGGEITAAPIVAGGLLLAATDAGGGTLVAMAMGALE